MTQIFVGLLAEGQTDQRFLKPIIEKALIDIAHECKGQVDIEVAVIECEKGNAFTAYVSNAAQVGHQQFGISVLIVHCDADSNTSKDTYQNKINPAIEALLTKPKETHCKNMAALVPIVETESWMLADKALLIKQINTKKSEVELGINGHPETFNDPKQKIEDAIRIGRSEFPKKLKDSLKISELYQNLGEALHIEKLKNFKSFQDFENNIRVELLKLNLLIPSL